MNDIDREIEEITQKIARWEANIARSPNPAATRSSIHFLTRKLNHLREQKKLRDGLT